MPDTIATRIPANRADFFDNRTGNMTREWYLFFSQMGNILLAGAQVSPSDVTVTASPFTYTNGNAYDEDVLVSGGGIIKMEFSRDGTTFYDTGSYYGMFTLSPGDSLKVEYLTAPTMTVIPR